MNLAASFIKAVTIEEIIRFALSQGSYAQVPYPVNEVIDKLRSELIKNMLIDYKSESNKPKDKHKITAVADSINTSTKSPELINVVDPLSQGFKGLVEDPVKRYCQERIEVHPDSLMLSKYRLQSLDKTVRDFMMENPNTPIIPGHTLATQPEIHVYQGYNFPFNFTSKNVRDYKVLPADDFIKLISKNPNNNTADKRLIDQLKKSTYQRATLDDLEILQAVQYALKNDGTLKKYEVEYISKLMRNKKIDRLLIGVFAYHEGKEDFKGRDVKGEIVPYAVLLNSYAKIEYVFKKSDEADTTHKKPDKRIIARNKQRDRKQEFTEYPIEVFGYAGAGALFDQDNEVISPQLSLGLGLGRKNPFIQFELNGGYRGWNKDKTGYNLEDTVFTGPYGKTTIHSSIGDVSTESKMWNIGGSVLVGEDFKCGLGSDYYNVTHITSSKMKQIFDEVLRDHNGNIVRDRQGVSLPDTELPNTKINKDYLKGGPRVNYSIGRFQLGAKSDYGKGFKPSYLFFGSVRF